MGGDGCDLLRRVSATLRETIDALDEAGIGQEAALHIVLAADLLDESRARRDGRLPMRSDPENGDKPAPWQLRTRP